ncbi:MAG: hypothetical protein NVS2B7_35330 [Herpetosiphon sp.]
MFTTLVSLTPPPLSSPAAIAGPRVQGVVHTAASESLVVNATVFNPANVLPGGAQGRLASLYRFATGVAYPLPQGDYAIELRNSTSVLGRSTFAVNFESEYHTAGAQNHAPLPRQDVSFIMEWVPGTTQVVLLHNNIILDQRSVALHAPDVTILEPSGKADWQSATTQTLRWRGTHIDGNDLSYTVAYSHDGKTWDILASELRTTELKVDVDTLAGSANVQFRVIATDGVNTTLATTTGPISVPNKPPAVVISSPAPVAVVEPDSLVVLQGTATDLEDGMLPDDKLVWTSDRMTAPLGTGPSVPVDTLQPGVHTITLTATDKDGLVSTASTRLVVGHQLNLPLIKNR